MDGINEPSGRQLEDESRERADAERKADMDLAPALLGKIDGEERPEGRLHRCTEEIEAVQTKLAAQRDHRATQPVMQQKGRADHRPARCNVCSASCQSVPQPLRYAVDTDQSPTARSNGRCGSHSSS